LEPTNTSAIVEAVADGQVVRVVGLDSLLKVGDGFGAGDVGADVAVLDGVAVARDAHAAEYVAGDDDIAVGFAGADCVAGAGILDPPAVIGEGFFACDIGAD
jgi:hypothetical protein